MLTSLCYLQILQLLSFRFRFFAQKVNILLLKCVSHNLSHIITWQRSHSIRVAIVESYFMLFAIFGSPISDFAAFESLIHLTSIRHPLHSIHFLNNSFSVPILLQLSRFKGVDISSAFLA